MNLKRLDIPDVIMITPPVHSDERGYFTEVWHARKYAAAGLDVSFVQDNESISRRGVLRGLHYQVRHPQGKLIRVVDGEVFDVAVDMRRSSMSFGRWIGVALRASDHSMLYVPPGFAHGFLATSERAIVAYKCTDYYHPEHERCLLWNDADVGIAWPTSPSTSPTLSSKDQRGQLLRNAEVYA